MHTKDYLTPQKAAELLDCHATTLYRWRKAGEGPSYIRKGHRLLYRSADILAWLEGRRVDPAKACA